MEAVLVVAMVPFSPNLSIASQTDPAELMGALRA